MDEWIWRRRECADRINIVRPFVLGALQWSNAKALVWDYARLQGLLVQYPQMIKNIIRILAGRLQELEERFRAVATEKVSKRLALVLLRLSKQVGKPSEGGVQVSVSREELGQMTGTTLFTISRVVSRWAERSFVVPRREAVLSSDPKQLQFIGDDRTIRLPASPVVLRKAPQEARHIVSQLL